MAVNVAPWNNLATAATNASTTIGNMVNAWSTTGTFTIQNCTITSGSTNIGIANVQPGYWIDVESEYDVKGKRLRRPAPLEFNRYINGSDLLEEFIAFAGEHGARQDDVLELPVELFVKWLIVRACEEDQEEPPEVIEPRALRRPQPRCLGCQRWMRRGVELPMHDDRCASLYFARRAVAA